MDQHDAVMRAALELGPGTRLAVIDGFVHHSGTLHLAADPGSIRQDGTVDAGHLRTSTCASGARVLAVHTSSLEVAQDVATDLAVPHSYEQVLSSALLTETDGVIVRSGSSWIILTRDEVKSALTRRRRLAARAAAESALATESGEAV